MARKTNFFHIPVRGDTRKEVDNLKDQLKKKYPDATYDELIKIFIEKQNKITLSDKDIKIIMCKSRGIIIWEI